MMPQKKLKNLSHNPDVKIFEFERSMHGVVSNAKMVWKNLRVIDMKTKKFTHELLRSNLFNTPSDSAECGNLIPDNSLWLPSMITPSSTFEYNFKTGESQINKTT